MIIAALWAGLTFTIGYLALESVVTDPFSERIAMAELEATANGYSRFGIVNNSHYPNGSWYTLYPFYRLGFDLHALRLIPLSIAAASVALLSYAVLRGSSSVTMYIWTSLALAVFVSQPGFRFWMGTLHEHSLGTSMVLIGIALGMLRHGPLAFYLVGLAASWIGYDFLPVLVVAVFFSVLLLSTPRLSGRMIWQSTATAVACMGGIATGVLLHLVQLSLAYASFPAALRDFFGAAAVRAAIDSGPAMNPEYALTIGEPINLSDRLSISYLRPFLERPLLEQWASSRGILVMLATAIILVVVWPKRAASESAGLLSIVVDRTLAIVFAFSLAILSVLAWPLALPRHAINHPHFLPRNALPGFLLVSLLPVRHAQPVEGPVPTAVTPLTTAKYLLPTILLMCLASSALWMLDWRECDAMKFARVYASSTAPGESMLYGPARPKIGVSSGGPGDWFGYWFSGVAPPRPAVFGYSLPGPTSIHSIVLGFWDRRFGDGKFTPTRYQLQRIVGSENHMIAAFPLIESRSESLHTMSLGGFLFHRWTFRESVAAEAIQISIDDVAGGLSKDGGALIANFQVNGDVIVDPVAMWYAFPAGDSQRLPWASVLARWRRVEWAYFRRPKVGPVAPEAINSRDVGGRIFEGAFVVPAGGKFYLALPIPIRTLAVSTRNDQAANLTLAGEDGVPLQVETHPVWPLGVSTPLPSGGEGDMRLTAAVAGARSVTFGNDAADDTAVFDLAVQLDSPLEAAQEDALSRIQ